MHKKLLAGLIASCMAFTLIGCSSSKSSKQVESEEQKESNVSFSVDDTEAVVKGISVGDVKLHEMAPLSRDGKIHGWVTLNQVQKLGIYDWMSSAAVDSGVKFSYTCNFKVDLLDKLSNGDLLTVYVKPEILRKGKCIGNPCIVGWSGFAETAVFDKNTDSVYVEYGVQPLRKSLKGAQFRLTLTDSNGNTYDPIYYDLSVLTKAKKGASLITDAANVSVAGASGAKYKIGIHDVSVEECFSEMHEDVYRRYYAKDFETSKALIFKYRVDYVKGPTSSLQVSNIDRSKKQSMLSTDLKIAVQGDNEDKLYYVNNLNFAYWKYSDTPTMTVISTDTRYNIHTGKFAEYTCNREISDAFFHSAHAVRFTVELNSDALAMTPKQLMKFNGRFIVFQRVIQPRVMHKQKTHKYFRASYTNDKKHE